MELNSKSFNVIQKQIIQCNSMTFKIKLFNGIKNKNHLIKFFHTNYLAALYHAVDKENIEIIKLLLSNDKIDPNISNILIY